MEMMLIYYILGIFTGIIGLLLFLILKNRKQVKVAGTMYVDITHNLAKISMDPVDLKDSKIKKVILYVNKGINLEEEYSREEQRL